MLSREAELGLKDWMVPTAVAMAVQIANRYESTVYVEAGGKNINAKSLMGMMSMVLRKGDKLKIVTDGSDEEQAAEAMVKYFGDIK